MGCHGHIVDLQPCRIALSIKRKKKKINKNKKKQNQFTVPKNRINPFHVTGLFLHPLKALENQRFSDIFRRHRKRPVVRNRLIASQSKSKIISTYYHRHFHFHSSR